MALTYDLSITYGGFSYATTIVGTAGLQYSPSVVYASPTGTGPQGTLVSLPTAGTAFVGEALIRDAVKQILIDTNAFDDIWIGAKLDWGRRPNVAKGGSVQPMNTKLKHGYDYGPMAPRVYESDMRVGIYVKNEDPEIRDAIAQGLLEEIRPHLSHVSLAGITVPDTTEIRDWTWHEAKDVSPPAREIEAHLYCDWLYGF